MAATSRCNVPREKPNTQDRHQYPKSAKTFGWRCLGFNGGLRGTIRYSGWQCPYPAILQTKFSGLNAGILLGTFNRPP
jgi:hypothetical protein